MFCNKDQCRCRIFTLGEPLRKQKATEYLDCSNSSELQTYEEAMALPSFFNPENKTGNSDSYVALLYYVTGIKSL